LARAWIKQAFSSHRGDDVGPGHPLVWPAAALILGALVAAAWQPMAWPFLGLTALGLAVGLGLLSWGRSLPALLAALIAFCWGCGHLALHLAAPLPEGHIAALADNARHELVVQAEAPAEPDAEGRGFAMRAQALRLDGRPASGGLRLSFAPGLTPPPAGARFVFTGRLRPIVAMANPGGFDYEAYARREGLAASSYVGKRGALRLLGPADLDALALALARARQHIADMLGELPPGPGRALLRALILGQRGEMSAKPRDAFGDLGAAHLLAISGLHVGLVWGVCFLALRLALAAWPALALRWATPKLAALLALLPAAAYGALAGGEAPTLRALIMIACLTGAQLFDRRYDPLGGLALAALIIVGLWPEAPLDLSFQPSFLAVGAILLAAAPLARWARALGRRSGRMGWALGGLAGWLCLSAVVGLAVMPLGLRHFHVAPLLYLPANALLIPLVAMLALPLALAGAGLGLLWPAAGLWLWRLALLPADWACDIALAWAAMPWAAWFTAGPSVEVLVLLHGAALAMIALRGRGRLWLGGALSVAVLIVGALQAWPPAPDGKLTVWILDVGQGSSAVIRTPLGRVLVVDGGGWPGSDFDFGRRVIAPFLWSQGLDRVDVLACSHDHPDHVGGLAFIAQHFGPSQLWHNGHMSGRGWSGRLLAAAEAQGLAILTPATIPRRGQIGGARTRLVWPPAGQPMDDWSENDRSLWLGLGLGGYFVWLPGDAGPKVEALVAPLLPTGGRHVLVAPHHGGKGSCGQALLRALRPELIVFSCGCPNNFGMPRPQALDNGRAVGARLLSTKHHGCIKIVTDGQRLEVSTFLQQPRACGG